MERVDLEREPHAERQRWRNGEEWGVETTCVAVGELADGRWYARLYDFSEPDPPACAYLRANGEWYARATARRWMRTVGGSWVEAGKL